MAEQNRPDICIVGAGALGIGLAEHARRLGARVLLVDRGAPETGDGPQQAVRLAALQASAAQAWAQKHGELFGLPNSQPKISVKAIEERASALAAAQGVVTSPERLAALGIEVVSGAASFVDPNTLLVGTRQVRARSFILAMGAKPSVPAIPGLDQVPFLTTDSILDNSRKLTHLLVIGGGAEALCLAQLYKRLGSEVSVVPHGFGLDDYDGEAAALLLERLAEEGMRILDGASVREINPRAQGTGVLVTLKDGTEQALDVSHVLVATGAAPDLSGLDLDKARCNAGTAGVLGQTNNRRIRVVGAGAGMDQWPLAIAHGRAVVASLLGAAPVWTASAQPRLILTDPPLAQIGGVPRAGRQARNRRLLRVNMAENTQAAILGRPFGLTKANLAPDGKVLSAAMVGAGAADLAGILALAMERNIPLADLASLSLPQPSLFAVLVALAEEAAGERSKTGWTSPLRRIKDLISRPRR